MDRKGKLPDQRIAKNTSDGSGQELLDINEATVEQLEKLTGIGRSKAEAIVDDRKRVGMFNSVSDLTRVIGIGKSVLDQNRALLVCGSPTSEASSDSVTQINVKQRETRSTSSAAKLIAMRLRKTTRAGGSASVTVAQSSSSDAVPYRTRSGLNSAVAVASAEKTVNSSIASSANKTVAELPSTSSGQMLITKDPKTPSDVRASLEPLFEVCERHMPSQLSLSSSNGTSDTVGDAAPAPGPSDCQHVDTRQVRSRCMSLRSNAASLCNGTMPGTGIETQRNGLCEQAYEDSDVDCASSGLEPRSGCVGKLCASPKKFVPCEQAERNLMKRKAEDHHDCCDCKKNTLSGDDCYTDCDENGDGQLCCSTDSSASAPKKQRLPSRKNPPVMMASWIQTFQDWSHAERLIALDTLVESCSPTQVRHIMQVIEPQFQRDFISFLPKELALYVLSFLEPRDLIRASQTCRYWRTLAEDNLLWREKCQEEGLSEAFVFGSRLSRRRQERRLFSITDKNGVTQWKSVYKRQRQIENNWNHGSLRPPKVLKGHDDHVITCLEFNGSKIVSGSDDNTLKVWSAVTGKCLRTLVGHTGGVWSSQMSGNIVISGSTDRTLKVWNIDTGQCVYTLYGHTSTVRCMHLHGNRLVSGSRDATLRVWDIDTGHCLRVLIGHVAAVRCVQFDGRRVVSGAYDYMVKIWDPETETCLQTLAGHTNRVYSLQFDGVHIVSGSLDTSIRVWNAETGACLHTLIGHQSLTSGMELRDNILVSGNADSTVKVWNITTGQCLQTLQGPNKHQSAVTCLQFNRRFVITSSDDGTVKIWDLRTGEFLRNLVALDSGGSGGVVWRIRCSNTTLVCAVGSRNGTEETKLLVLDFDLNDDESSVSVPD